LAEFFIVIVGRYAAITLSYYIFECAKGDKTNKLSFREISFLTYAALIRGAIAFGLVENLDEHSFDKKEVIVSTTYALVILSTVIFGGLTPIVQKLLLPSKKSERLTTKMESSPQVTVENTDGSKFDFDATSNIPKNNQD